MNQRGKLFTLFLKFLFQTVIYNHAVSELIRQNPKFKKYTGNIVCGHCTGHEAREHTKTGLKNASLDELSMRDGISEMLWNILARVWKLIQDSPNY